MSRGATIITQKENKGEYGDSWKWNNETLGPSGAKYDWDIYAHTVDQTNASGIPYRYISATNFGSNACTGDYSITNGKIEYSNINISDQYSCNPYPDNPGLNAGNWYNFPAATAGSDNHSVTGNTDMPNSICPKGWRLPPNADNKSYNTLIRTAYSISTTASDAEIFASPLSFVRLGYYNYDYGSLYGRGGAGNYWPSTANSAMGSHVLHSYSGYLNTQDGGNRSNGFPIRCVSR